MSTADDGFPQRVKEDLRRDVGGYCSAPFCGIQTFVYDRARRKDKLTGDAAHICGARLNAARYHDLAIGVDRHGYDNGIWLCAVCHRMIDHSACLYPVQMLLHWKLLAIEAHQAGGRRRQALMVGSDLTRDHQNAAQFLKDVWQVRVMFREAKFYVSPGDRFNSTVKFDKEFARLIRNRAGMYMAKPWNAYHPHWTFTPEIQVWESEIVRMAGRLAEMPALALMGEGMFDFYHQVDDEGNLVFRDESTSALHIFVQMLERFDEFLADYKGPQQYSFGSSPYSF
ncbi:hypothetical protein ACIOWK_33850 [Pseudomonas protegens]|uniref:hypothetical protein n=1 Tax=Pseudomonas protegens TaxID=380021 RepID=UPI00382443B8